MPMTYRRPRNFTERSHRVIELASAFAAECGQSEVHPVHIAIAMIREGEGVAATALQFHGFSLGSLERELTAELSSGPTSSQLEPQFTAESQALLDRAGEESSALN